MDFSALFRHTTQTVVSVDGLVLSAHGATVVLRRAGGLEVITSHVCTGTVGHLAFSPDGRHFVACDEAAGRTWIFAVKPAGEIGRIEAGVEGCRGVRWLGDEALAVWSEHGVRVRTL